MPGVEAASLASRPPLAVSFSPQNVLVPGMHGPADRGAPVNTAGVSAGYFDTLGVPQTLNPERACVDPTASPWSRVAHAGSVGR